MKRTIFNRRQAIRMLASTCCVAPWAAHATEVAKLKFTSFEPPMANITGNVLMPFAREVSAASQGTLQIDMFPGGTLGRNPLQQLKLVTDGIADIGWIVLPYTPGRFDDTEVVGLPFVSTNATEASIALHRLYASGALVGFEGLKMLAVGATPPVGIHGKQPVRMPADLRGKRVRVSGDHLTRMVEALGGAPVSLGAGQIAESLSRGVVDMTLNNWGFVGDFKVNEVSSEHFEIGLGAVAVGVVMRKDRFDALPAAAKSAIEKYSGEVLARKIGEAFDRQEKEVRERVSKSGKNQVVQPSPADTDAWKKATEPLNESWRMAKPRNQRTYNAFVEQLKRIRAAS
ncbi:MAG: TRAP transporter substrate-binding protein [Hydrogenophaga sp.]|jgi:TRAP-type C4-dicarboxylate transport system substrate-binding protein|uniref:TRAP transporter substrate-binding protein n=1 Tax=Hydrogenophaga sp. TaxID=1904254 RepID=UPI0027268938|nr:TRAP transporter substrate-binding protein [Hydrogenophaga sp.]MDO9482936.1 TRAP transporter substrate-binding protein [Hydrogenophaga sp.]MDO9571674.1 TRAP transporter substrate-binding protein [Hydrogenophaga sp.]MDP1895202.1 TRAP transporter substrate-binding protein [Hydrogenophaga sp.]MDP2092805.1 TRAP transporter substrate-binding protein [Hydrogenophaga sp.]MDP2219583.1 TRAP transporter substrate-binding protein [Hydrogenophaga sp.]